MKKDQIERLGYIAVVLVLVFSVANIYLLGERFKKVDEAKETAKELMRPARVEVTKILARDCDGCYDIQKGISALTGSNVNITKEDTVYIDSTEGWEILGEFKIDKAPAMLVGGEVNKTEQLAKFFENNGVIVDKDTAIFTKINPPYFDVAKGEVVGRVRIIHITDKSCEGCMPLDHVEKALAAAGVGIVETKTFDYLESEAKELISKHAIKRVPAMLISHDIDVYEPIKNELAKIAAGLKDGFYAMHSLAPPYRDLEKNKIYGMVRMVMLSDKSCKECYDVKINQNILLRFGIALGQVDDYDISSAEGKELISKYKITGVPMILVSPDIEAYPTFVQVWKNVGTVEGDGWLVMRQIGLLGNYKDLVNGTVVRKATPATPAATASTPESSSEDE